MNKKIIRLIKLTNDKYSHIQELETLGELLSGEEKIVAKTTMNSHYNYKYLLDEQCQNPENHVDIVLAKML